MPSLTGLWMALLNPPRAGIFESAWLGAHAVAPLALIILLAVPYTRRGLTTGSFGIVLLAFLGIWSVAGLALVPIWWPTTLGGTDFGVLIAVVGFGILILAVVGGWAYKRWHNPREALRDLAFIVPLILVFVAADRVEKRYNINWWLTAAPAIGLLFLVNIIIERRRKRANNR